MDKGIAISVKNVSKTFRIPHEKVSSVRGAFVGALSSFHLPFSRGGRGGVSYEEFKALDDVSFEVKKGEFFGIIGRNGSGKSTLLKVLAGIYEADKGKVKVDGMISPFLELGIGFNPELSGRDNVYLNATVLGMTQKQIDEKFDAIVAFSELERFIDQKLKNYSSGMQVRLAFSVSIHANRDILLMDEVLAVGDSNFQAKCLDEFNQYKKEGKTIILVSHDLDNIEEYCDRVLLLQSGKIIIAGDTKQVIFEYKRQGREEEKAAIRNVNKENESRLERWGTGEVRILKVSTVNIDDKESVAFTRGSAIRVRIDFETIRLAVKPNFSVAIFRKDNDAYCYDINTSLDDIVLDDLVPGRSGSISITFNDVNLIRGTYYVKVGIFGNFTDFTYDFINNGPEFQIYSHDRDYGIVYLKHDWDLSRVQL